MTSTSNLPAPNENLSLYLQQINAIPMLTAEEEMELARRLKYDNDLEAAQRLVLSHLRYVAKLARNYSGYGLPYPDLVQEGNIGLMKAVKRYDPDQGVRLVTFAMHWIKAEIHEFIIRNWRMVKVATTKAQRKLFFNLRRHKKDLKNFTEEEAQALADKLDVPLKDVREMEARMSAFDASLDAPIGSDDDTPHVELLPGNSASPEQNVIDGENKQLGQLHTVIDSLDERSQDIIVARYLPQDDNKTTLKTLADKYGISIERVRQLEQQALRRMRDCLDSMDDV